MRIGLLSDLNTAYVSWARSIVVGPKDILKNSVEISRLQFITRNTESDTSTLQSRSSRSGAPSPYSCKIINYSVNRYPSRVSPLQRKPMAASGFQALFAGTSVDSLMTSSSSVLYVGRLNNVSFRGRKLWNNLMTCISSKIKEPSDLFQFHSFGKVQKSYNGTLHIGKLSRTFHASCFLYSAVRAANDVPLDASSAEDLHGSAEDSSEQKTLSEITSKLLCGACYLPHPDKEATGGEDAYFICEDEQVIGVADGVGGWAEHDIDAGEYARLLMYNSVNAIKEGSLESIDLRKVLEKAHSLTNVQGSSTVCIISLTSQGVHAINIGDSGFIIIRDGSLIFSSPAQQHDFNFPYQIQYGFDADLPSSGQAFTVPVAPGDVIVAGTDGLFDNLYKNEIGSIVVDASRARLGPHMTAEKIAALARERALDKHIETPFSAAAQDAGFLFHGGKLDDITVVVSYVTDMSKQ